MKCLDSSFLADYLRGRRPAGEYVQNHRTEELIAPTVVFYELYHGAVKEGRQPSDVDRDLDWVTRMAHTDEHALEGARIRDELNRNGQRIQHPDMMLAGIARAIGAPVVTADGDFERISDLAVENHREMY